MPFQRTALVALSIVILSTSIGCGKKELQAQVIACEGEIQAKDAEIKEWQARFDRESERWGRVEESVSTVVPETVEQLRAEQEQIIELVPAQVQDEVRQYLDSYFNTVMDGFTTLHGATSEISTQLEDTRGQLTDTRGQLQSANRRLAALGDDTAELKASSVAIEEGLATYHETRKVAAAGVQGVVDQVVDFDTNRINCKKCADKLTLSRKERETITAFHQNLISSLTTLQSTLSTPDDEATDG